MSQGGLGTLNQSLSQICDSESCPVWVADLEIDNRIAGEKENSVTVLSSSRGKNSVHLDVDIVPGSRTETY